MNESSNLPVTEKPQAFVLFHPAEAPPPCAPGWAALDGRGLLAVSGPDAEPFLQGQLTQDMARILDGHSLLAAHCTPKGRISTLFRAWPDGQGGFLLDCPATLQATALRRLRLYVLRAKVLLADAGSAWCRTALFGAAVPDRLAALGLAWPDAPGRLAASGPHQVLALPGQRWQVLSPAAAGAALRQQLPALLMEDAAGWDLASLRAGEPEVLAPTAEAFVPQMLNLDTLDGISFRKGCYTGQEIVARTHYLGKVKRRMVWLAYAGEGVPEPGQQVPVAGDETSLPGAADGVGPDGAAPVGGEAQVVLAMATSAHGGEALAVLRVTAEPAGDGDGQGA